MSGTSDAETKNAANGNESEGEKNLTSCYSEKGRLAAQRLQLPGLRLPTQLSFGPAGTLRAAGRAPTEDSETRCIALGAAVPAARAAPAAEPADHEVRAVSCTAVTPPP